ncbi:hypothetical protein ACPB8Q_00415 [Methanocaldococcus indicus]|uniref:hypothetical protein n=1 Tax=Methanocaldococcus indicus TaxID=213231 RepID=UPI003C6D40ED
MFKFLSELSHKRELNEAVDEIFIGVLINYMYKNNAYLIEILSDSQNNHSLTFKFKDNPVFYKLKITVSRKVEGLASKLLGSQTVLEFEAILRNEIVEPEDIIRMYQTDFKNMFKIPLFGNVVIDHDLNYIIARTKYIKDLNKYVSGENVDKEAIYNEIDKIIKTLEEHLKPLKKELFNESEQ